jgi:hypothetical protein
LLLVLVALFALVQPAGALTFGLHAKDYPPWVSSLEYAIKCLSIVEHPLLSGDRFLLVAPLWREGDHYRMILGVYGVDELALPRGARVYRVLVPSRVTWKRTECWGQVITYGPWREVRYSLQESGGLLRLRPEETVDHTFVVEAGLPARGEWVRVALAPGNWIVALGWTLDFNVLTLDGKVLFQGRHPYDEVEYDLPGGVHLAFWCGTYALDLHDGEKWASESVLGSMGAELPGRFDPRWQYEHGLYYGYCIVLEVRSREPLILEFPAPRPGAPPISGPWKLVTRRYERTHTHSPSPWRVLALPVPPVLLARKRRD